MLTGATSKTTLYQVKTHQEAAHHMVAAKQNKHTFDIRPGRSNKQNNHMITQAAPISKTTTPEAETHQ